MVTLKNAIKKWNELIDEKNKLEKALERQFTYTEYSTQVTISLKDNTIYIDCINTMSNTTLGHVKLPLCLMKKIVGYLNSLEISMLDCDKG